MLAKTIVLACASLFFVTAQASPLEKRDAYQITGVLSGRNSDGSVPFRKEIRELQKNGDQWNLYLIGLRRFMDMDQSEKTSYYQIAGTFSVADTTEACYGFNPTVRRLTCLARYPRTTLYPLG